VPAHRGATDLEPRRDPARRQRAGAQQGEDVPAHRIADAPDGQHGQKRNRVVTRLPRAIGGAGGLAYAAQDAARNRPTDDGCWPGAVAERDEVPLIGTPGGTAERPAVFFSGPAEWRAWLEANHDTATELWMGLYRKHVDPPGLQWAEAVEEALCFGWIDSVAQRIDDVSRRQRWTPRKPTSNWSKVNLALVHKLIAEGRMTPAGLAAYERRRPGKQGIYAYEQDGEPVLPPEYEARLRANHAAAAWFDAATPSYRRNAIRWVLTAQREATRDSRMTALIDDSAHGRLIKQQRYGDEPAWVTRNRTRLGLG
jgi:uncharacterized protein YdeI (YjbR/CyaY-like superfamily)